MIKSLARHLVARCFSPRLVATIFRHGKTEPFSWPNCRKILVIKLDVIGDFVLATPFLRELRRNAPKAEITLVVRPHVKPLADTCPYVNCVLAHDPQTKGLSLWQLRQQWRSWKLARRLRNPRADLAILPRRGEDAYAATYLAWYSGAKAIVAFSETATLPKQEMNAGYDCLVTHVVPAVPEDAGHEATANLRLLTHFGGRIEDSAPELWLTSEDEKAAAPLLALGRPLVAISTGTTEPGKQWPSDRFVQIATWLKAAHSLQPVLLGLNTDPALGEAAIDLRGRTSLRETAAILRQCRLFVGNDSGLKHVAAAMGCPVVESNALRENAPASHNASPIRFCAIGAPSEIVRPPDGQGELAIHEVSVPAVKAACERLLSARP